MVTRAYFTVNDLIELLNDGTAVAGDKKDDWKKAQQKTHAHLAMTCDDRADLNPQSVDPTTDDAGWKAHSALKNKHGDAKNQRLCK